MVAKIIIINIAFVIVFGYLYSFVIKIFRKNDIRFKLSTGLIFGAISIFSMLFTFRADSGVIFDARSVILSLAGIMGGWISAIIAAVISIIYRVSIGGSGLFTGCLVIGMTSGMGILFEVFIEKFKWELKYFHVFIYGLFVHVFTLLLFLTLPKEILPIVLSEIWKPFLLAFPAVTVIIYFILNEQEKRVKDILLRDQSEKKYRSLFENMNEGFVLFELICDQVRNPLDFKCLDINPNFTKITGLVKEEVLGKTFREIFPSALDEPIDWIEKFGRVAIEQQDITTEEYSIVMGKWLIIHVFSIDSSRFAIIFSDITERKKSEIALRESETLFHAFFDNSLDAILLTIPDGRILAANPSACEMFGRDEKEIVKIGRSAVVDYSDPRLDILLERRKKNGSIRGELNLVRANGEKFPAELSSAIFYDSNGNIKTSMIIRDMTEIVNSRKNLEEQEAVLRYALEGANDGIWDYDVIKKRIYISSRGFEILGINHDKSFLDFDSWIGMVHPEDVDELKLNLTCNGSVNQSFDVEHRILTSQGNWKWVQNRGKVVSFSEKDIPLRITGTYTDISLRKSVELSLQKSEELYRTTLDSMMEGCQIIDFNWTYIYINDVAEIHNRRPKEELLGKKMTDVWPGIEKTDVYRYETLCMTERKTYSLENEFVFPNGKTGWYSLRIQPVPEGIFILSIDISDRKKNEKALLASEAKYRALVEQSLAGIYIFEKDKFLYVNNRFCEIFGYSSEELLNTMKPTDVVVVADRPKADDNINKRFSGEVDSVNYIAQGLRKDKKPLWIEIHGTHIILDDKDVITGTILDITQKKLAEEKLQSLNFDLEQKVRERTSQLEEANVELEAFAYSVSHDLRAPLRAIEGFSKILNNDFGTQLSVEGKRLCSVIQQNSQKMSHLINELLEFSKVNRYKIQLTDIDTRSLVNSIFIELTDENQRNNIDLIISDLSNCLADEVLIKQVWYNLISNAIKFTSKCAKPQISITSSRLNNFIEYSVKDNGAGFNPKYSHKIFGVFQRLHSEKEFEGTGVGLALVERIIKRHGGKVGAKGNIDQGAEFTFSLPDISDHNYDSMLFS